MTRPDYNGGSIVNLAASVLEFFGLDAPYQPFTKGISNGERLVFLLVDAMGWKLLTRIRERIPFLKGREIRKITSVFPTTTASALATLSTATPPAWHGILGYRILVKEFGTIVNVLHTSPDRDDRRDRLVALGLNPKRFVAQPTIFQRLADKKIKSVAFLKYSYNESALSTIYYRGARMVPYLHTTDLFTRASDILAGSNPPDFLSLYWDVVDSLSHLYGPEHLSVEEAIIELFAQLERLLKLPGGTTIVITADHGMHRTPSTKEINLIETKWLWDKLAILPAGEFRSPYLYLVPDENPADFAETIRLHIGNNFEILTRNEALQSGLFGDTETDFPERIGDIVMLAKGGSSLTFPYSNHKFAAYHGSLTDDELYVPLIIVKN